MLCQSSFIKPCSGSPGDYQLQLPASGRAGCQPSAAPLALLTAERVQTQLGLLMTSALKIKRKMQEKTISLMAGHKQLAVL